MVLMHLVEISKEVKTDEADQNWSKLASILRFDAPDTVAGDGDDSDEFVTTVSSLSKGPVGIHPNSIGRRLVLYARTCVFIAIII